MTRGWWRRNAVPLVALAILAPTTAVVIGGNEWTESFGGGYLTPVEPEGDGTLQLGGATWGPVRAQILDDTEGLAVPAGAKLIVAVVPVDPDGEVGCLSPVLIERETGRQWEQMRGDLGLPSSPDEPTSCLPEATEPYSMFLPYIVPEGAGPFWVDVSPVGTAPEFVRFSIDP